MSSGPAYFIKIGKIISGPVLRAKLLLWKAGKLPVQNAVSGVKAP